MTLRLLLPTVWLRSLSSWLPLSCSTLCESCGLMRIQFPRINTQMMWQLRIIILDARKKEEIEWIHLFHYRIQFSGCYENCNELSSFIKGKKVYITTTVALACSCVELYSPRQCQTPHVCSQCVLPPGDGRAMTNDVTDYTCIYTERLLTNNDWS
jgi:hypothetical protein